LLTRDEVMQLIIYLIVATALLLAIRARGESIEVNGAGGSPLSLQTFGGRVLKPASPGCADIREISCDGVKFPLFRCSAPPCQVG
jgi:hypothetical protein